MTLNELVNASAAQLQAAGVSFGHGTLNAHDEAAWLVLWRLGLPLDDLDGVADQAVDEAQRAGVEALVAERIAIQSYRAIIHSIGDKDSTTRDLLTRILAVEEQHADEFASLLDGLPDK